MSALSDGAQNQVQMTAPLFLTQSKVTFHQTLNQPSPVFQIQLSFAYSLGEDLGNRFDDVLRCTCLCTPTHDMLLLPGLYPHAHPSKRRCCC